MTAKQERKIKGNENKYQQGKEAKPPPNQRLKAGSDLFFGGFLVVVVRWFL